MENSRRGVSGKVPDFLGTGRGFKPGLNLFFSSLSVMYHHVLHVCMTGLSRNSRIMVLHDHNVVPIGSCATTAQTCDLSFTPDMYIDGTHTNSDDGAPRPHTPRARARGPRKYLPYGSTENILLLNLNNSEKK